MWANPNYQRLKNKKQRKFLWVLGEKHFYTLFNNALVPSGSMGGRVLFIFFSYQKPTTRKNVLKGSRISKLKESLGVFYENSKSVRRLCHATSSVPPLLRQAHRLQSYFLPTWRPFVAVFTSSSNFNQQHSYLASILRMWLLKMPKLKQSDHRKSLIFPL